MSKRQRLRQSNNIQRKVQEKVICLNHWLTHLPCSLSLSPAACSLFFIDAFYRILWKIFQFIAHGNKFFDNDLCLNRFQNESRLPSEFVKDSCLTKLLTPPPSHKITSFTLSLSLTLIFPPPVASLLAHTLFGISIVFRFSRALIELVPGEIK